MRSKASIIITFNKRTANFSFSISRLKSTFDSKSFDWILMSNVIGHLSDKKAALKEVHRVLKNPGKIVITDWTRDFQTMNLVHFWTKLINYSQYRSLRTAELESLLDDCDFNHLHTERYKINWFWGLYTIQAEKKKV